jgi:ammonium transporter, Amt family
MAWEGRRTIVDVLAQVATPGGVDAGATAWVLAATALVSLMSPGLALFYGGMVGARNVLTMLMQCVVTMAVVGVVWVLVGYSLAFGSSGPWIGDLDHLGLFDLDQAVAGFTGEAAQRIPPIAYAGYQMTFAMVTAVLLLGATADRLRLGALVPFMCIWPVIVYAPVAHWVFSPDGWAARMGVLDFAGGTVVHVNAGAAALAMALVLGRRRGWPDAPTRPHNLPLVVLGAALLWFGWFGFNAGSALDADRVAGFALVNTNAAAAAGLLGWILVERLRYGKATTLGAASGLVSGLVAVTPCAGFVQPVAALLVGVSAGAMCALAVSIKTWFGYDDSLDVVGVHLVAGSVGSISVGLFATLAINPAGRDGLFASGRYDLLAAQMGVVLAVAVYSFLMTYVLGSLLDRLIGTRVPAAVERVGLDIAVHGELAYASDHPAHDPAGAGTPRPPTRLRAVGDDGRPRTGHEGR